MPNQPWTWDEHEHPGVAVALAAPSAGLDWCGHLETAAGDAIVGKILCVCAASAIAREFLAHQAEDASQAEAALGLLDLWIDEPTDERFDRICSLIFEDGSPELDPHGIVWWTLRTATSSVGNFEAGWALVSLCNAAMEVGLAPERLRAVAERAASSRRCPIGGHAFYEGADVKPGE